MSPADRPSGRPRGTTADAVCADPRLAWVEGDVRRLDLGRRFDLVLMAASRTRRSGPRSRRRAGTSPPGGWLAFETRNPLVRPWEGWTPLASRRRVGAQGVGTAEVLHRLLRVDGPLVGFGTRHRLPGGEVLVSRSTLRFMAREEVASAPPGLTGPPGRGQ